MKRDGSKIGFVLAVLNYTGDASSGDGVIMSPKYLEYIDNQIDVLYDGGVGSKTRLLEDKEENGLHFRGVKNKDVDMIEEAFRGMDASWSPIKSNMVDDPKLYAKALISTLESWDRQGLGAYWVVEDKETGESCGIVWIEKVREQNAEYHFAVSDKVQNFGRTREVVETGIGLFIEEFNFLGMEMVFPSNWK